MTIEYEPVIGLEVHAQLDTASKMFCRCSTDYAGAEPNSHICPICSGFPGVLPKVNEFAVELAVRVGLALNCSVAPVSRFDRKHYTYPDLPKGYQITQYDLPIAVDGSVEVALGAQSFPVGIIRAHMEEDTGKLVHQRLPNGEVHSLVDLNRAGVPLLEIVSAPDLASPAQARAYMTKLRQLLQYIGASTGNMEEGALRADANVSVRPKGSRELGAKVEIKNLNSFRMLERALEHEIERQTGVLRAGGSLVQETRGWDDAAGVTVAQRTKEFAEDYRYFPEPDIPPIEMDGQEVARIRGSMAELPEARAARFAAQYGVSGYDAELLTATRELAEYFEQAAASLPPGVPAKTAANWITGELFRLLKQDNSSVSDTAATPQRLAEVIGLVADGTISAASGREVLEETHRTGTPPREVVQARGMAQISDEASLVGIVKSVAASNPSAVADYRSGKQQVLAFLIGQVMKQTAGRAKPDSVRALLLAELGPQQHAE